MRVDTAAFDRLDKVIRTWHRQESMVKPTLHRRANGPNYWYRLQLVDVDLGEYDQEQLMYGTSRSLDRAVEWTTEKLKNWPNCTRKSWDMWDFKSKHDAEKFITLFHLSWQQ